MAVGYSLFQQEQIKGIIIIINKNSNRVDRTCSINFFNRGEIFYACSLNYGG
jgi:hypothetical protein